MYYVVIEDNKILSKGECPCDGEGITCVEVSQEIYDNLDHYIWNGTELVINPNYEQEKYERQVEECRKNREQAYASEVDCITAHIQRLKDEEQTPEVIAKIQELIIERDTKVEEIKARYPYPEES